LIVANAVVEARFTRALIDLSALHSVALVTSVTGAGVRSYLILTGGVVGASECLCCALVDVLLARFISPTRGAHALGAAHFVQTLSAVFTRFAVTLIFLSAGRAREVVAVVALALVMSRAVCASGVGLASKGLLLALVDVGAGLAVAAETRLALTLETARNICALRVLGTIVGALSALVDVVANSADVSEVSVARVACAGVTPDSVCAVGVLIALGGAVVTLIDLHTRIAVGAVAWLAFALVRAGGVGAHGIGVANVFVLFALINLHTSEFVALQPIAGVTHTLVGTLRVLAGRVGRALVLI